MLEVKKIFIEASETLSGVNNGNRRYVLYIVHANSII